MSVTCCPIGVETDDAVHNGDCPTIDRTGERGYIDDQPNPSTGRIIRWRPGPYFEHANGHLWRADRGPYARCERAECGLVYPRWNGERCPAAPAEAERMNDREDALAAAADARDRAIEAGDDPVDALAEYDETVAAINAEPDLITWLRAQLDEDERLARQAFAEHNDAGPDWREQWSGALNIGDAEDLVITNDSQVSRFMEAFDPARVLAEVEAKRRILDEVVPEVNGMDDQINGEWGIGPIAPEDYASVPLLKLLAQPYAGRPGWHEEWSA